MSDIPVGPSNGSPTNFTVTIGSVHFDLTSATYTTLFQAIVGGRAITLQGDGDVFYRWSPNTSGDTVDETMVATGGTPANQCMKINAGERRDEMAPGGTKGIVLKGSVATILRTCAS